MSLDSSREVDFRDTSITELATIIATHLQNYNIEVVLVGGLAVEIYTDNLYLTKDIDMVNTNFTKPSDLNKAMEVLGFYKKGRIFINGTTEISVEFPPAPLSVGDDLITNTTIISTETGEIPILWVDDIIKDRLAAFLHWKDNQSLIQAITIILKHSKTTSEYSNFYAKEGNSQQALLIESLYQRAVEKNYRTMEELENLLAELLIKQL